MKRLLPSTIKICTCFMNTMRASNGLGRVAQSVMCQSTDACLTADPGVASLIPIRSHTFVEIIMK